MGSCEGIHWKKGLERDKEDTSKMCYLSRYDRNREIRTKRKITDGGKYFFGNRNIKSWNQLPAGLLASFHCKLNQFRKRVKNVVTGRGIGVGFECK
jgi:hypothetical protein